MQVGAVAEFVKALNLRRASEQATSFERTYAASGFETAIRTLAQDQLTILNERAKRGEYVGAWEYARTYTRLGNKE